MEVLIPEVIYHEGVLRAVKQNSDQPGMADRS